MIVSFPRLLKCSLRSQTPLSDTFLEQSIEKSASFELLDMKYGLRFMNTPPKVKDNRKKWNNNIHLNLIYNKVDNTVLYAVVKEDFVNLLFTFLSVPLGYIIQSVSVIVI